MRSVRFTSMANTGINYLFPPNQINNLPTWRFIVHFKAPLPSADSKVSKAVEQLKTVEWKIIRIPCDLDSLRFDPKNQVLSIPIEVTPERRRQPNALASYESDFWKICGNVLQFGFGDIFYEAIDW